MTNKNELNAIERTENMKETNSRKKQRGFTLAETLIALTILGIVAAITVPQLVRKHVERANRTKFKKVMTVYDFVMNKIVTENDLKSNTAIQSWATKDNTISDCSVAYNYFKSVKDLSTDSKCKFKTADGVFWDITDIQKPIVALKENDLTDAVAQSDTNRAFYLYAQYDGTGILRVTEPNFNYTLTSDKAEVDASVDRLWAFLKGETNTSNKEVVNMTTRQKFYSKYLNNDFSECGYTREECLASPSLCPNCKVTDAEVTSYFVDSMYVGEVVPNTDGSKKFTLSAQFVPYQFTTTFYDNGKIKTQNASLLTPVYKNGEQVGVRNTTYTYNYDENGNYTGCTPTRDDDDDCQLRCSDYMYKCE